MDQKKKVLIVDDDVEFVQQLTAKFETQGMGVVTALSGKEALDYVRDNNVDFIVLDFIMPEMDGYTFYHIMTHDMRKTIPTIILTNLSGENKVDGLEVFVKNDTDLDTLVTKVKDHINKTA